MTNRLPQAALIMPVVIFCEMLALGADGPFLGAVAAVAEIIGAMAVIWLLRPGSAFWRAFLIPLILAALAWGWLASAMVPGPDMFGREWIAPDLLPSALARFLGGCAVLVAAAAVGWRRRGLRISVDCWLLLGLVQLAVALILRQTDPHSVWGLDKGFLRDRFTGTFVNANAAGCLYAMLSTLALGRGILLWRSRFATMPLTAQIVTPIALLGGLGACAITGSRTALVVGVAALILLAFEFCRAELRMRAQGRVGIALICVAGAVAFVVALVGQSTTERFRQIDEDGSLRIEIWSFYWKLAHAAPLGYGPGGMGEAAQRAYASVAEANMLWFVNSPHDIVLSLLINGGWPYLALMALLVGALLWPLRLRAGREAGVLLASTLYALVILMVCSSVDIALDMPGMAALGAMLLGLTWGAAAGALHDNQSSLLAARAASTSGAAGLPETSPRA